MAVNAYVFMPNHVHMLLTPSAADRISRSMHSAARRYAGYYNKKYQRTGTLWEGRFRASLVRTDRYLLACHRYIDLNPVRAGMVARPDLYPWSSHRHYAMGEPNPLVTPHPAIIALGGELSSTRDAYRALFSTPLDGVELEAIRSACRGGRPIGADRPAMGRPPKGKLVPDTTF